MAYWYPFLGWSIFWIGLIVGIILFAKSKRLYSVFYVISIALYIFTAGFMIDAFNFGKNGILITLVFSAILFMVLGYYFSKVLRSETPTPIITKTK